MKRKIQLIFSFLLLLAFNVACTKTDESEKNKDKSIVSANDKTYNYWIWARPNASETDEELAERYQKYAEAGVVGVMFENDSEKHFRAAKAQGLQAHRWMWIMNRGDALKEHPEWAAISRDGKSCATNPPYVDYYRWMCPSRPEVKEFLENQVRESLSKDYVDGIHFDYVRFCDGILAVNLWSNYDIVQTEEFPEYDFCYCDVCKAKFKETYQMDLDSIEYPQESLSWRAYRYDAVSNIVEDLVSVSKGFNKPATAAVFPTPDVAKKLVKQDWTNWELDAVFPMVYHGFYKENVPWIGRAVKEGVRGLDGRFPLYAGLYLPDFKDNEEVEEGIEYALANGADGIAIFGESEISDDILKMLGRHHTRK